MNAERRQDRFAASPARVRITTHSLWRLRLARDLPRYLLYATSACGLLASARFAIEPPRPAASPHAPATSVRPDLAARGYAVLFVRRYLTWDAADPQPSEEALAAMVGPTIDQDAGLSLPASGAEHVQWAEVVQERIPDAKRRVYTVAAQTDSAGLVYVTVGVARDAGGRLALSGYPAFVGAPPSQAASPSAGGHEVTDRALSAVVERALRNYLGDAPQELAADLVEGAEVSLPEEKQTLQSVQRLTWSADRRSVLAVVQTQDARGARFTLGYEADVERIAGRWEISAIQTDPTE